MAIIPEPGIDFNPPVYLCKRANARLASGLTLDGRLDKPFWEKAPFTAAFADISGPGYPAPRFETRAKLLWDDDYLYIGAELMGSEIWATQTERDSVIFVDNDFEIFIDPDGDTHEYLEFEMNALNTVWDLLLTKPYLNGGTPINAFDVQGLKTAVHITGRLNDPSGDNVKWSIEAAFPLSVLNQLAKKNTPAEGVYWRMNFSRVQWLVDSCPQGFTKRVNPQTGKPFPEDNWVWSPTGVVNIHYPELWGFVFFTGDDASKTPEIPEIERVKWAMRKAYYRLHAYYEANGRFTNDFAALSLSPEAYANMEIITAGDMFAISAPCGDKYIRLYQDGLFHITPIKD